MENDLKNQEIRDSLVRYLKERFRTTAQSFGHDLPSVSMIEIQGKNYFVKNNKKFLVNKIFNSLPEIFDKTDVKFVRQTIKQFIDNIN